MSEKEFLAACHTGSHVRGLDLRGARLAGVRVPAGAVIRMCTFDNSMAVSSCFDTARLEDSTAVGADFSHATFRAAHLTETSFSRAVLREAVFDDGEGDGIDFRGADLAGASLKGVRFDEADFRGADLRGADLSRGRFHAADFRGALLEHAVFDDADYSDAMFDAGEGPVRSAPPPVPEAADAGAIEILNQFLALLPAAISAEEPAVLMNRVQDLVGQTAASAGYSAEQQQAMHDYLADLSKPGGFDTERLRAMLASLNCDSTEPPEDLKAWLEPLMKAARNRP